MDLASNIDGDGIVSLVGATNRVPCVNINNYKFVVDKGNEVPFNSILPWKVFFGCSSDTIKPIEGDWGIRLWQLFQKMSDGVKDKGSLSSKKVIEFFFSKVKSGLPQSVQQQLEKNIYLVYPMKIEDVDFTFKGKVSKPAFGEALRLFQMKKAYKMLLKSECPELTENDKAFLVSRAKRYIQNSDAIDSDVDINSRVIGFDEEELPEETRDIFEGGNLGGF
jgi:hypothetical protein